MGNSDIVAKFQPMYQSLIFGLYQKIGEKNVVVIQPIIRSTHLFEKPSFNIVFFQGIVTPPYHKFCLYQALNPLTHFVSPYYI